jgi:hypothetical protein
MRQICERGPSDGDFRARRPRPLVLSRTDKSSGTPKRTTMNTGRCLDFDRPDEAMAESNAPAASKKMRARPHAYAPLASPIASIAGVTAPS